MEKKMRPSSSGNMAGWLTISLVGSSAAGMWPTHSAAAPAKEPATPVGKFSVLQRWKMGGAGGWDYLTLDSTGARLFISRADHVDVVDTASGKLLGTIPDTKG